MIITNFDDILPGNVTQLLDGGATPILKSPAYGAFGNGIAGGGVGFNVQRFDDFPINPNVKTKLSALCRLPWLGSNTGGNVGFVVGGVGFVSAAATNINSNFLLTAVYDGRNGTSSSTSMLYQVRASNMGTSNVIYSSNNNVAPFIGPNIWTRIEVTVEPASSTETLCTIEWISHSLQRVLRSTQHVRPRIDDLRPHIAPYDLAHFDSVQLMVGDEPYLSNVPVKVRVGNAWVNKPMKKLKSGLWVPAYPRVNKSGQDLW